MYLSLSSQKPGTVHTAMDRTTQIIRTNSLLLKTKQNKTKWASLQRFSATISSQTEVKKSEESSSLTWDMITVFDWHHFPTPFYVFNREWKPLLEKQWSGSIPRVHDGNIPCTNLHALCWSGLQLNLVASYDPVFGSELPDKAGGHRLLLPRLEQHSSRTSKWGIMFHWKRQFQIPIVFFSLMAYL